MPIRCLVKKYGAGKTYMTRKILLSKRGQSLIEVTLITPLLLAALYVVMDFGILFFITQYTQTAVREAARIGSIMPDCAINATVACVGTVSPAANCPSASTVGTGTIVTETCSRLPSYLTAKQVTVTLTGTFFPPTCMREVQVTASGTYPYGLYRMMRFLGMTVPATLAVTRSADARYQAQPVSTIGAC